MIYVGLDVSLNSVAISWWRRLESLLRGELRWPMRHRFCGPSNHLLVKLSG